MSNGFTLHKINHSSPSAINKWVDAPCAWIAQYLYGRKGAFSAAAAAGTFAEQAVSDVILGGMNEQDAIAKAVGDWNKKFPLCFDESATKRRDAIPSMASQAIAELAQYGTPESVPHGFFKGQHKISLTCNGDGWTLPIEGYLDFYFPKHGLIVDLKTTFKMPSDMSDSHRRQQSVYSAAMGNMQVKFLYVTPKKSGWLWDDNISNTLSEIKTILNRQERFLRVSPDRDVLRDIVPVNTGSYYWSDDINTRKELYGI
jgi:hypothetical protein